MNNNDDYKFNELKYQEEMSKLANLPEEERVFPAVKTAVQWWCDQLTGKYSTKGSTGLDNMKTDFLVSSLQQMIVESNPISEDQIATFAQELTRLVMEKFKYPTYQEIGVRLFTDYGPMELLNEASSKADIKEAKFVFPMKTNMKIYAHKVEVHGGRENSPNGTIFDSSIQLDQDSTSKHTL